MQKNMSQKWFHAIGVCGKATSNIAVMFKEMGWFVTGSDAQFFPPASTLLEQKEIPTIEGFNYKNLTKEFWEEKLQTTLDINKNPDLVLIVSHLSSKNKEVLYSKRQNLNAYPFAKILGEYLIKENSIVIVGTAGKTTTTALITKSLKELNLNPSYMIGAEVLDFDESIKNTNSHWSVIEGDEYHSPDPLIEDRAKFREFKPKYLVITNIGWEHQDIYPTQEKYIEEFVEGIKLVPSDGIIFAKANDKNIDKALDIAKSQGELKAKVIRYGLDFIDADYYITETNEGFEIFKEGRLILSGKTKLIGKYNLENMLVLVGLFEEVSDLSSVTKDTYKFLKNVIENFKGPKKRLEILFENEDLTIVDDFAVAPNRAKNSLTTLRQYVDNKSDEYKIIAVFEPNSGSRLKDETLFNEMYKDAFKNADEIIIPSLSDFNEELLTSEELSQRLNNLSNNSTNIDPSKIVEYLTSKLSKDSHYKTLIVFFSSYRLDKVAKELVNTLKK